MYEVENNKAEKEAKKKNTHPFETIRKKLKCVLNTHTISHILMAHAKGERNECMKQSKREREK